MRVASQAACRPSGSQIASIEKQTIHPERLNRVQHHPGFDRLPHSLRLKVRGPCRSSQDRELRQKSVSSTAAPQGSSRQARRGERRRRRRRP